MKKLIICLLTLLSSLSFAQKKTLLIFDLQKHTVDSITNVQFDSANRFDQTLYFRGTIDTLTEILEQIPPEYNVYPNSQFTKKRRAAVDYDISKYPVRTSVKISFERNDTLTSDCSGSMVSRRHVLTAAHCVSGINTDSLLYDSLYACPAFDNGQNNVRFPCSRVQKIFIFKDWSIFIEDIALLQLEEPVGDLTGWISIGFNDSDSALQDGIFYKFSYPAITMFPMDSAKYNGDTLYYNYGKIDIVNNNQIGIDHTNGIQGESGSSLIKVVNNQSYTSYGVLSFSNNLMHCRFTNWKYYYLESILHHDLIFALADEYHGEGILVFPNPANDKIWVTNNGRSEIIGLSVLDIYGNIILRRNPPFSWVDINSIPSGIYFVQIRFKESTVIKKLVKNGS